MAIFSKHQSAPLHERIQKARNEGRTQQALELAKQLAKQQPNAEHQELLRAATFERGAQLLKDGKQREAIVVFQNALTLEAPPEYRAAVAAKLAAAGEVTAALGLFSQLADTPERGKIFAQAADAALLKGTSGRALLPPDLHAGFDSVIRAAAHVEKQEDEAAREALQAIGLSSPFLEWKVMLRGLIAYYQNDDARALDNWQRLDAARQPWRLIAPLRFHIDAAFRAAQPEATRKRLQSLLERSGNSGLLAGLRALSKFLRPWDDEADSRSAFRAARDFARLFGASEPGLVLRLGHLFYSKVAEEGMEVDLDKYRATFTAPPDDPNLNRLRALSAERAHADTFAVDAWLDYEKDLESIPDRFPGPTAALARALVWEHLGVLIDIVEETYKLPKHIPSPEECYRKSIALVAGRLRPHQLLLAKLKGAPKKKKHAIAAAQSLVAAFPEQASTWEYLGDALLSQRKAIDAVEAFRAALKANPLNAELRRKLAEAVWARGLKLATPQARAKAPPNPAKYRPPLEEALRFTESSPVARLAEWSLFEQRFGHADFAGALIAKAEAQLHSRVALPLALHLAAQLDKKASAEVRAEYETRWQQAVQQKPNPHEALSALDVLRHFDGKDVHDKKAISDALLPKLTKPHLERFSEEQLLQAGQCLLDLDMNPSAKKFADHAARRFPNNPYVQLLLCDIALATPSRRRYQSHTRSARPALERARQLALEMPREKQERLMKEIQAREQALGPLDDFPSSIFDIFGRFGGAPFGFDDDNDDDW